MSSTRANVHQGADLCPHHGRKLRPQTKELNLSSPVLFLFLVLILIITQRLLTQCLSELELHPHIWRVDSSCVLECAYFLNYMTTIKIVVALLMCGRLYLCLLIHVLHFIFFCTVLRKLHLSSSIIDMRFSVLSHFFLD